MRVRIATATKMHFCLILPMIVVAILVTHAHAEPAQDDFTIQLDVVSSGFDQKTCWVHPRAGVLPPHTLGNPNQTPAVVLTMNKLLLTGSDVYYAINDMRTDDLGKTWSRPKPNKEALGRWDNEDGTTRSICDFWPGWHAKSGKLLGVGHTIWYTTKNKVMSPRPRHTGYSVYDPVKETWSKRKNLQMPDESKFKNAGAGSSQRYDLANGEILLPIYFKKPEDKQYSATIVLARFDGQTLDYVRHGTEMSVPESRGISETSVTKFKDRYYVTLRNDLAGYVSSGEDGLHYDKPKKWTFDDGSDLGNYNTQQHWVTHSDGLYLVYTRRGANNDHVMRHRAPLFIGQVDPDRLCVIRSTERILVPEHGARLGNFGVTDVSENETWVTVAEWMQTKSPNPFDFRVPMKYGSDNRVFAARILWKKPNRLVVH